MTYKQPRSGLFNSWNRCNGSLCQLHLYHKRQAGYYYKRKAVFLKRPSYSIYSDFHRTIPHEIIWTAFRLACATLPSHKSAIKYGYFLVWPRWLSEYTAWERVGEFENFVLRQERHKVREKKVLISFSICVSQCMCARRIAAKVHMGEGRYLPPSCKTH